MSGVKTPHQAAKPGVDEKNKTFSNASISLHQNAEIQVFYIRLTLFLR